MLVMVFVEPTNRPMGICAMLVVVYCQTNPTSQTPTGLRFVLNTDNSMASDMRPHLRHIYAGPYTIEGTRTWADDKTQRRRRHLIHHPPSTTYTHIHHIHTPRHLGGARGEAPAVPDRPGVAAAAIVCGEAGGLYYGPGGVPMSVVGFEKHVQRTGGGWPSKAIEK